MGRLGSGGLGRCSNQQRRPPRPFLVLHVVRSFLLNLAHVLTRSDRAIDLELVLLRQQAAPLRAEGQAAPPVALEQVALASLAATLPDRARVALVFMPATRLRWQREIVKRRGTFDNRPKPGRPPVAAACVKLRVRLARENPRWVRQAPGRAGQARPPRSRSTITRLLRQHRLPPAPERGTSIWRSFLGHDREYLVACACFTVDTLSLQRLDTSSSSRSAPGGSTWPGGPRHQLRPGSPSRRANSAGVCRTGPGPLRPDRRPRRQVRRRLRHGLPCQRAAR